MATEEPSSTPLEQKEIGPISPTPIEEMAVDAPAAKAVNGHAKSDENLDAQPTTNGTKEITTSNGVQEGAKSTANKDAFALNNSLPDPSPLKAVTQSTSEDTIMKEVNGTSEEHVEEKESEVKPSVETVSELKSMAEEQEVTLKESKETVTGATAATPADPQAEAMDVDVAADRPDLTSSAEHATSTQDTSAMSVDPVDSTPQDTTQPADMSKLDIQATQDSDAISPTQDIAPMLVDSAAPSAKIPREREEDSVEEPAAKRAKTEERTEPIGDSLVVATGSDSATPAAPDDSDAASNAVPDEPAITQFQNKRIREVLGNVKKTKNGSNFRKSVQDLWPMLWTDYTAKIKTPVDISLMEVKLRENKYENYGQLKQDLKQLHENAFTFNGPTHDVTRAAAAVQEYVLIRLPEILSNPEPPAAGQKGKNVPTRHAEPRAATQRRESQSQSTITAASPKPKTDTNATSNSTSATAQAFAIPPSGIPQIRRDSTREDNDRPKRPIHPPKNRDPEYGSKANRKKKLDPEQRFFETVLDEVKKPRHFAVNQWFMAPVDPVALNIPNYFKVIRKPMDISLIVERNYEGEYKSVKDIEKDIKQIVTNAEMFNGPDHEVTYQARQLEALFKTQLAGKDKWMERHYPVETASATAASPAHSYAESEDESDGEPEEEDSVAIRGLEQRLTEEQAKLNDILLSKKPDPVMTEVQQNVVAILQRKLVEEKTKFHSDKKPKSKKKSKPKPRPSGSGSGGKKAATSGGAKKPPTTTKKPSAPKKRTIGAMEKAVIAEGINELDGALLTKAVDIIKRDTGQNENDDGEMELDIDSLSSDALSRLYDLINKAHPDILDQVKRRPEFAGQASTASDQRAKAGALPKAKKNKPMNKHEQEKKIEQLRELKAQLQRQGSGSQEPLPSAVEEQPAGESSEESDSEEE
ncbi:Bromodomain-containing protein [Xylariaceae sp. FL0255]|nr:Bromodomain-containing protein [Xylariaceae sp. FL0255]